MGTLTLTSGPLEHALGQIQLAQPGYLALRLIQAAVSAGSPRVQLWLEPWRLRVRFEPDPSRLGPMDLQSLPFLGGSQAPLIERPGLRQHLSLACLAALAERPASVELRYLSPEVNTTLRLTEGRGAFEFSGRSHVNAVEFVMNRGLQSMLATTLLGIRQRTAIVGLLNERCWACPIPVILDGFRINRGWFKRTLGKSGRGEPNCLGMRVVLANEAGPGCLVIPPLPAASAMLYQVGTKLVETPCTITLAGERNDTFLCQVVGAGQSAPWDSQLPEGLTLGTSRMVGGTLAYLGRVGTVLSTMQKPERPELPEHYCLLREFVRLEQGAEAVRYMAYLADAELPFHPFLPGMGPACHALLTVNLEQPPEGRLHALADGVLLQPYELPWAVGVTAVVGEAGLTYDPVTLELRDDLNLLFLKDWLRRQLAELSGQAREYLEDESLLGRLELEEAYPKRMLGHMPSSWQAPVEEPETTPIVPEAAEPSEAEGDPGGSAGLAAHLDSLFAEGRVESSGVFTLAVKQAHLKMGKFQHADPAFYLIKVIQGAVACGAPEVRVGLGPRQVQVRFTPGLHPDLLGTLPDRLVGAQMGQGDALDHLVVACSAAQATDPESYALFYQHPQGGFAVRVSQETFETRLLPESPEQPAGMVFSLRRSRNLLSSLASLAAEHSSIGLRFAMCPIPIYLDRRLVNGERYPGRDRLTHLRVDTPPERLNLALRLVLDPAQESPGPGGAAVGPGLGGSPTSPAPALVPGPLRSLAARYYHLNNTGLAERVRGLQEVAPTMLCQLRSGWHHAPGPPLPSPLSQPAVRGWRSMVYYLATDAQFPDLPNGVLLRDYFRSGLIRRQYLYYLPGARSPVPRGGPRCLAMFAWPGNDPPGTPAQVWFLKAGMLLEPIEVQLGLPGLLAWVADPELSTDLSHVHVIRNQEFDRALDCLRAEAAAMGRELLGTHLTTIQPETARLTSQQFRLMSDLSRKVRAE